jgi:hypothetical protein
MAEKQAKEPKKEREPGGFGGQREPVDPYLHRKFIVNEKPHMNLPEKKK